MITLIKKKLGLESTSSTIDKSMTLSEMLLEIFAVVKNLRLKETTKIKCAKISNVKISRIMVLSLHSIVIDLFANKRRGNMMT